MSLYAEHKGKLADIAELDEMLKGKMTPKQRTRLMARREEWAHEAKLLWLDMVHEARQEEAEAEQQREDGGYGEPSDERDEPGEAWEPNCLVDHDG
jgi:hypothetical protein